MVENEIAEAAAPDRSQIHKRARPKFASITPLVPQRNWGSGSMSPGNAPVLSELTIPYDFLSKTLGRLANVRCNLGWSLENPFSRKKSDRGEIHKRATGGFGRGTAGSVAGQPNQRAINLVFLMAGRAQMWIECVPPPRTHSRQGLDQRTRKIMIARERNSQADSELQLETASKAVDYRNTSESCYPGPSIT